MDVETKKSVLQFAYEDIWYYNNYHVLGHVFVFPHYMRVTFFDSNSNFELLQSKGVDFDWYKNDDSPKGTSAEGDSLKLQKKFVILKDSNTICFDNGEGRIQVYKWLITTQSDSKSIIFEKSCSLRDH